MNKKKHKLFDINFQPTEIPEIDRYQLEIENNDEKNNYLTIYISVAALKRAIWLFK